MKKFVLKEKLIPWHSAWRVVACCKYSFRVAAISGENTRFVKQIFVILI